jgi:hypothetical protein
MRDTLQQIAKFEYELFVGSTGVICGPGNQLCSGVGGGVLVLCFTLRAAACSALFVLSRRDINQ